LEGLNADKFAVSGPRKVAAFLFKTKKRIRIYDMEIEEEDDDDENETLGNSGFSSELNTSY
jgi:anaphase-promoting complex subunit 4